SMHGRLLVAHLTANLLGWMGLTVIGTLLTLWPTILRTKMAPGAERASRQALPVLGGALGLIAGGALLGFLTVAGIGVLAYLGATLWALRPALAAARARPPQSFAAWSVLAAIGWLAVSLVWLTGLL